MRRLLQLGALLLALIAVFAPLVEFFDRWDAPGLTDDTEFTLFALVSVLCLVLLVSRLISLFTQQLYFVALPHQPFERFIQSRSETFCDIIPFLSSPPLRI